MPGPYSSACSANAGAWIAAARLEGHRPSVRHSTTASIGSPRLTSTTLRAGTAKPGDDLVEMAAGAPARHGSSELGRDGRGAGPSTGADPERSHRASATTPQTRAASATDRAIGPGMVERRRQRHDPVERDRAERALDPDHAAVRGGSQDRADRLRADRGRAPAAPRPPPRNPTTTRPGVCAGRPRVARGRRIADRRTAVAWVLPRMTAPGGPQPGDQRARRRSASGARTAARPARRGHARRRR